ncbi:hypothetical protein [Kordiimonas sp. SCSIO 12610]|uniref:hypothetical protein n=1 Tax=Kordiimonas sp. SCSIO 12610 TaxID=2829597 RepID=UPI00210F15FA|nr:hypothetical protein [Kordiimonas sp. SCSIO 12610]UTW55926.1 hypothetical protein KFF44_03260 [Kordiimonas sp. SCSIO 12610]
MFDKRLWALVFGVIAFISFSPIHASDNTTTKPPTGQSGQKLLLKMDNSIAFLTGTGFALPGDNLSAITFEHKSIWAFGDVFAFYDKIDMHSNPVLDQAWFFKAFARMSLGKTMGLRFPKSSFVSDLSLGGIWERGRGGLEGIALGLSADLRVPGFRIFRFTAFSRKDTSLGDGFDDVQFSIVYAYPFKIGQEKFLIDGFMDYSPGFGSRAPNFHAIPQIKWDLGTKIGRPGKFFIGIECDIWENQFGVLSTDTLDSDQFSISALVKWHF